MSVPLKLVEGNGVSGGDSSESSDENVQLTAVLKNADLNTTTTTANRLQLQSDLGVDLSERKAFIGEQVDLYLQKQSQEQQEVEERGEDEGSEEGGERGEGEDEDEDGETLIDVIGCF